MKDKNETENRTPFLLAVIAVSTLVVSIIGATFAYFTAQRGEGAQAEITVKTSTSDSLEMGTFTAINIVANQDNFGQNKGTRSGISTGEISLTANDAEATDKVEYCYTTDFYVESNDFVYSKPDEQEKLSGESVTGDNDPELVLTLTKIPNQPDPTDEETKGQAKKEYTTTIGDASQAGEEGAVKTLNYYSDIYTANVCDGNEDVHTDEETPCPSQSISGYDVTTLQSGTNIKIQVPGEEGFIHKITAPRNTKITDYWEARVYFINYNYDQEKNTGHKFHAQLKFTTVNCETGQPDESAEP